MHVRRGRDKEGAVGNLLLSFMHAHGLGLSSHKYVIICPMIEVQLDPNGTRRGTPIPPGHLARSARSQGDDVAERHGEVGRPLSKRRSAGGRAFDLNLAEAA